MLEQSLGFSVLYQFIYIHQMRSSDELHINNIEAQGILMSVPVSYIGMFGLTNPTLNNQSVILFSILIKWARLMPLLLIGITP